MAHDESNSTRNEVHRNTGNQKSWKNDKKRGKDEKKNKIESQVGLFKKKTGKRTKKSRKRKWTREKHFLPLFWFFVSISKKIRRKSCIMWMDDKTKKNKDST